MASYRDALPAIVTIKSSSKDTTRFRLIKKVGEGGMAKVYLAEVMDIKDDVLKAHNRSRQVAIKFPHAQILEDESATMRFLEESRLSVKFRHPNILRAYTYGLDQEDVPLIVMEFVPDARTLADIIESYHDQYYNHGQRLDAATGLIKDCLLPKELILQIMEQIGSSVQELHRQNVIHRDQKPDNYLVVSENPIHLKLTDFGIAKSFSPSRPDLTRGGVVGTPYYLAPEQISPIFQIGLDGKARQSWTTGKHSDIWSIGVILYELLTGSYPFYDDSSTEKVMLMVRDEDMEATPIEMTVVDPDPDLSALCMDCLVKDPAKRIATIEEFLKRLAEIKNRLKPNSLPAMAQQLVPSLVPAKPAPQPPPPRPVSLPMPAIAVSSEQDRPSHAGARHSHSPTAFAETVVAPQPRSVAPSVPDRVTAPSMRKTAIMPKRIRESLSRTRIYLIAAAAAALIGSLVAYCSSGDTSSEKTADRVLAPASAKASTLSPSARRTEGPSTALPEPAPSAPEPDPAASEAPEPDTDVAADAPPLMSSEVPPSPPSADRKASVQLRRGSREERWFRTGARFVLRGNCDAANGYLVRVKLLAPQYPETYRYLGDCARLKNKTSAAREFYQTYLSFQGTSNAVLSREAQAMLDR